MPKKSSFAGACWGFILAVSTAAAESPALHSTTDSDSATACMLRDVEATTRIEDAGAIGLLSSEALARAAFL